MCFLGGNYVAMIFNNDRWVVAVRVISAWRSLLAEE